MPEPIISPAPAAPVKQTVHQSILLHQVAVDFRQETLAREAFEDYCHWYEETARQNQADLATMKTELEILGWLRRS